MLRFHHCMPLDHVSLQLYAIAYTARRRIEMQSFSLTSPQSDPSYSIPLHPSPSPFSKTNLQFQRVDPLRETFRLELTAQTNTRTVRCPPRAQPIRLRIVYCTCLPHHNRLPAIWKPTPRIAHAGLHNASRNSRCLCVPGWSRIRFCLYLDLYRGCGRF